MGTGFGKVKMCASTVGFKMMGAECRCADERIIAIVSSCFDDENLESRESFGKSACDNTSSCPTYINLRNQTECTSDNNDVHFLWNGYHV